jgi:hypothetical protein
VIRLRRIRFGTVALDDLPKRGVRELTGREVVSLLDLAVESKRIAKPRLEPKKSEEPTANDRRLAFLANRPTRRSGTDANRLIIDSDDSGGRKRAAAKKRGRGGSRRSGGSGGKRSPSRSGRR